MAKGTLEGNKEIEPLIVVGNEQHAHEARSQTFLWGGQIGQILGPFMITRGLSCDLVGFFHLGVQMTPPDPPPPGYGPD